MNDLIDKAELTEQWGELIREELMINRSERIVRNVALVGQQSRNGYRYSERALERAVELYHSRPVFLDHGSQGNRPRERSTRDLVGSIVSARYEAGRIRGDIQVLGTEAGETFLTLVESETPGVGMSHVVLVERGADPQVIESIQEVLSVDVVVSPATTMTFRESATEELGVANGSASSEEVWERKYEQLSEELLRLTRERDELRATAKQAEETRSAELRRLQIANELRCSGLPQSAITPMFLNLLTEQRDAEMRRRWIEERREVLRQARKGTPESAERSSVSPGQEERWIVAALTGNRGKRTERSTWPKGGAGTRTERGRSS